MTDAVEAVQMAMRAAQGRGQIAGIESVITTLEWALETEEGRKLHCVSEADEPGLSLAIGILKGIVQFRKRPRR